MRRFLLPLITTLLPLLAVSDCINAEDAPRAPRNVRRAARRAECEAHARTAAPRGLSDGLTSAGRHAPLTPRLAAHQLTFDESEMIVVTSNEFLPPPCRPVTLREGVFSATSEPEPIAVPGNIIQSREFLPPLPPRDSVDQITILEPARPEPIVTPGVAAAQPILRNDAASNVLSRVVVAGELAGVVLPEPGRLDPGILQASLNQLPVAVTGAIAFAEVAPPPLPPREQAGKREPAAELCDKSGVGCVLTLDQIKSARGSDEEARIEAALNQPVTLHFDKASLSKVFQHIATIQGINIVVDDTALAEEGVTTHEPVSIKVDGVMLKSALGLILNSRNLGYLIEDEVLKITSRQRREGELIAQVYSVADLIGRASSVESPTSQRSEAVPPAAPSAADFENVVELIRSTIQPNSWNESGGPAAIVPHPGSRSLVIRQTRRGHLEIAHLLDGIRRLVKDIESSRADEKSSIAEDGIRRLGWEFSGDLADKSGEQPVAPNMLTIHPQTAKPLTQMCSVHFDEAPLGDALRYLAEQYGLSFSVDVARLAAEDVTLETPVTVNVDGIQIKSSLNLILMPLNLQFEYWDGVVSITSRDRQVGVLTTRVYPAADLLCPRFRYLQQDSIAPENRQAINAEALVELITCTVDPNGWVEFGGQGNIACHEPTLNLVVRQTARVHQELSELLEQLRRLQDAEILLEVSAVRVSKVDFARVNAAWGTEWYGNRVESDSNQIERLESLLDEVDKTVVVGRSKIILQEGQTWRLAAGGESDTPYAFLTAVTSEGRRSVDCNIAVPRTIDGMQMLQRVTVFTTTVGNTCVINASERSPVIENYAHFGGIFSDFGAIRELSPGEGDGVIWDESADGVTLVFITPRIIVSEEEEEPLAPRLQTSESDHAVQHQPPEIITVMPRIIIQEEEEELLGIPFDPSPAGSHTDQNVMQPALPPGTLPDSFDLFGIPTQDLLFRDDEPESRLILQTP